MASILLPVLCSEGERVRTWGGVTTVLLLSGCRQRLSPRHSIRGEISRVVDTAHLEFEGLKTWNYEIQRADKTKIVLTMPAFEVATEAKLKSYTDAFIKDVSISKNGPDQTFEVTFELGDAAIESFDYLTDDPSRLIIDFYKKAPEAKPAPAAGGCREKRRRKAKPHESRRRFTKRSSVKTANPQAMKFSKRKAKSNRKARSKLASAHLMPATPISTGSA